MQFVLIVLTGRNCIQSTEVWLNDDSDCRSYLCQSVSIPVMHVNIKTKAMNILWLTFAFHDTYIQFWYCDSFHGNTLCDINLNQSISLKITTMLSPVCIQIWLANDLLLRRTFNCRFISKIMTQDYLYFNISKYCWLQEINVQSWVLFLSYAKF